MKKDMLFAVTVSGIALLLYAVCLTVGVALVVFVLRILGVL